MTDQDKELKMRISMLLDSDLDGRENFRLIENIESNNELKSTWTRYNLIGDVMRSSGSGLLADKDFAAKVNAMIADEPTVLAPKALKPTINSNTRIATLGLAASLAVVAIIVGKSVNDHSEVFQTASQSQATASQLAVKSSEQADSQFNDYLVMHNETAYMAGSAAMLPYVRMASSRASR
jgi:sigma-E factor negative regulatory protein RseA